MSSSAAYPGGNNYEGEFHFRLSEECNTIDIKEPPNIKLDIKDKEGETKSIISFKVKVNNASYGRRSPGDRRGLEQRGLWMFWLCTAGKHLGYFLTGSQTTQKTADRKSTVSATCTSKYDKDSGKPLDLSKGNIVQAINSRNPPNKDLTFIERLIIC